MMITMPRRLRGGLCVLLVLLLPFSHSGCLVSRMTYERDPVKVGTGRKVTARSGNIRAIPSVVVPAGAQTGGARLRFEEAVTVEHYDVMEIHIIEQAMTPALRGAYYVWLDVLCLKYLWPALEGVSAYAIAVKAIGDGDEGAELLMALVIWYIAIPIGTAYGAITRSPASILLCAFDYRLRRFTYLNGISHALGRKEYKEDSQEDKPILSQDFLAYEEGLTYWQNWAHGALVWIPIYPGFTEEFNTVERVIDKKRLPANTTTKQEKEDLDLTRRLSEPRLTIGGVAIPVTGETIQNVPAAGLDVFAEDDLVRVRLLDGTKVVAESDHRASEFGVRGLIPRQLPEGKPGLRLRADWVSLSGREELAPGDDVLLLLEFRGTGAVPAYGLTLEFGFGAPLATVRLHDPALALQGNVLSVSRTKALSHEVVRIRPQEDYRIALRYPYDGQDVRVSVGDRTGQIKAEVSLRPPAAGGGGQVEVEL